MTGAQNRKIVGSGQAEYANCCPCLAGRRGGSRERHARDGRRSPAMILPEPVGTEESDLEEGNCCLQGCRQGPQLRGRRVIFCVAAVVCSVIDAMLST